MYEDTETVEWYTSKSWNNEIERNSAFCSSLAVNFLVPDIYIKLPYTYTQTHFYRVYSVRPISRPQLQLYFGPNWLKDIEFAAFLRHPICLPTTSLRWPWLPEAVSSSSQHQSSAQTPSHRGKQPSLQQRSSVPKCNGGISLFPQ